MDTNIRLRISGKENSMFRHKNRRGAIVSALTALVIAAGAAALPAYASSEEPAQADRPASIETVSDGYTSLQTFTYDDNGQLLQLVTVTEMDGMTDTITCAYTYAVCTTSSGDPAYDVVQTAVYAYAER